MNTKKKERSPHSHSVIPLLIKKGMKIDIPGDRGNSRGFLAREGLQRKKDEMKIEKKINEQERLFTPSGSQF